MDEELERRFKAGELGGYIKSPDDARDFIPKSINEKFPKSYKTKGLPILNQGVVGSCVAHALVTCMMASEKVHTKSFNDYSRGYIYLNRSEDDYQGEGMIMRQALKEVNHKGDCLYVDFPVNTSYNEAGKKVLADYNRDGDLDEIAKQYKVASYYRLYTENEIKAAILRQGAVFCGCTLYSTFGPDTTLPDEKSTDKGSHAMAIIGWTKDNKWIVQNSWGFLWGHSGTCYIPFEYPFEEYWEVVVNSNTKKPERDNFWNRVGAFFKSIFKVTYYYIVTLFNKIFKRK